MKQLSEDTLRLLDKILGSGVRPGMNLEEESALNKANLFYLLVSILGLIMVAETLRAQAFNRLPLSLAFLTGALLCFAVVARTGRPFWPNLLLLGGLSLYFLVRAATGGYYGTGFMLILLFPFLYFATVSFNIAVLLFFSALAGLMAIFFLPGGPLLRAEYSEILRQRIIIGYIFSGCAAMLGEFIRWRAQQKLSRLMAELVESSRTDQLTGLRNRKAFWEISQYEIARSLRESLPLSIIVLDVDRFKEINDSYGHNCGDAALRHLADLAHATLRRQDIAARLGGDEFIVLLPGTPLKGAIRLAEKLRFRLETSPYECNGASFTLTASMGVHELVLGQSLEANIAHADAMLYEAKHMGRNKVHGRLLAC